MGIVWWLKHEKMYMSSKLRIVGLMCCLFHITLFAQNYDSFNLETFFGSDHDWKEAQYRIQKKLDSLEDSPITQIKTDHDLHEILKLGRTLRSTASRLVIYSILRSGANLNDTIASEIYQVGTALDSRVEALLSPLERAIMHLPKDSLNSWTSKPEFLPYLRRLNRIQKAKGYTLDGDAATLMKRIKGFPRTSVDVFWSLHGEAIDWPKRYVNGDTLVFNQQAYVNLSNLKDLSIRDEGIEHMFGELKKFENVFGLLYYKRIQGDYLLAKSEGFSSGMEAEWYKRDHIPKEGLENMIAAIRGNKEIIQDYVAAKADLLDRKINYSDLFKIIDIKGQDYTFSSSLDMVRKVAKAYDATFHEKILSVMEQPWSNIAHSDTKENTYSIYPPVTGNPYFIFNYYPTHKHARALMGGFTLMSIWSGLPKESIPENGDDPAVYANGIIFLGDLMYDEFLTRSLGADKVAQKQALINALDFYWYYALRWMIFSELDHLLEQKIISGEFLNGAQISKIYHGLLSQYFGDKIEIPEYFGMEWLLTHILFMSYEHQYWPASMAFATYLLESEMDRSKIVSDVFFKAPTNLEHDRSYEMLKEYNIDMTSPEVYNSIFYRMKRILDKIKSLE